MPNPIGKHRKALEYLPFNDQELAFINIFLVDNHSDPLTFSVNLLGPGEKAAIVHCITDDDLVSSTDFDVLFYNKGIKPFSPNTRARAVALHYWKELEGNV